MKREYIGCENAASATAKICFPALNTKYYFGEASIAADFIDKVRETWDFIDWPYEIYHRKINRKSGLLSRWYFTESGTRTGINYYNYIPEE